MLETSISAKLQELRQVVNELLGEEVPTDQPLMEAGLDSIGTRVAVLVLEISQGNFLGAKFLGEEVPSDSRSGEGGLGSIGEF